MNRHNLEPLNAHTPQANHHNHPLPACRSTPQWLAAQPTVGPRQIDAQASGPSEVALLHAALFDSPIRSITIVRSLATYRSVLETPVHRNIPETAIPGVLLHYDLDDLLLALSARPIHIVQPVDASGAQLTEQAFYSLSSRVEWLHSTRSIPNHITFTANPEATPKYPRPWSRRLTRCHEEYRPTHRPPRSRNHLHSGPGRPTNHPGPHPRGRQV